MDTQRFEKIAELFEEVRELAADERNAFLAHRCGDDTELRAEVESLLAHHASPDSALRSPLEAPPASLDGGVPVSSGRRIGRYELRRIIASGGMGTVYEALQDHPHRLVALKVLRRGAASSQSLKRFRHEAETLGRLRHPNIAQIYDAGTFTEGDGEQPYFAMELVKGKPLTPYAENESLGTRQRLDLFVKVCDAVQYAHQKGVIHRDLKPDNILVDEYGEPRILDFGVARATDSDIQATTLRTDIGQLIGTVPYMSPEQVTGDPSDLDTRSDVYSLGVVLYELMCGRLPHNLDNKTIPDAVRVIREEDPTPLSSVNRFFRGDLETTVAKALEKEKERRYQTAAELAADIRHYLRNEPIVARPASTFYQLRKFARRNRTLVGGIAGIFVVLVAGTVVSSWQAARATAERAKAVVVKEFLRDVIGATDIMEAGRRLTPVQIMDQAVRNIDQRFGGQPEIEAEIRHLIGQAFASRGEFTKSIEFLRAAHEIRQRELDPEHPDTLETAHQLGRVLLDNRQLKEAEETLRRVWETRGRVLGEDHPETIWSMASLAYTLAWTYELEEGEALGRRAFDGLTRVLGKEHERTLRAQSSYRAILSWNEKRDEAEAVAHELLEACRRTLGEEHRLTIKARWDLGVALWMRRGQGAEALCRSAWEASQRLFGDNDYTTLIWTELLGWRLYSLGQTEEGERLQRQGIDGLRRVFGEGNLQTSYAMNRLAQLEESQGNLHEAEDLLRRSLEVQLDLLGDKHPHPFTTMADLGWLLRRHNQLEEAEPLLREAMERQRAIVGEDHWRTRRATYRFGAVLLDAGRFDEAEAPLLRAYGGPDVRNTDSAAALEALIELYNAWGKPEKAAEWRAKLPTQQGAVAKDPP